MKNLLCIFVATILLSACVPEVEVDAPAAQKSEKFNIDNYEADVSAPQNLEGLWLLTSSDYSYSIENSDGTGSVETGSTRLLCGVTSVENSENNYTSTCQFAPSFSVVDANAVSSDGSWVATIVNNAQMTGSINHVVDDDSGTKTRTANFDMIKVDTTISDIASVELMFDGVTESANINNFMEFETGLVTMEDGEEVDNDSLYVIYAYGSDGYIISYSSENHGASLSVGTANISVESTAYQFTNIADDVTTLSFDFDGENSVEGTNGSNLFSGTMDISFEAGL